MMKNPYAKNNSRPANVIVAIQIMATYMFKIGFSGYRAGTVKEWFSATHADFQNRWAGIELR